MMNYIKRHQVNEDWSDAIKPGTLAKYILWSEIDINQAIKKYVKKFNLS